MLSILHFGMFIVLNPRHLEGVEIPQTANFDFNIKHQHKKMFVSKYVYMKISFFFAENHWQWVKPELNLIRSTGSIPGSSLVPEV